VARDPSPAKVYRNEGVTVQAAPRCYLCGDVGTPLYTGLRDRLFDAPGVWSLLRCPTCALVWLDPRPDPDDIPKLYSQYYTHEPTRSTGGWFAALKALVKRAVLAGAFGYGSATLRRTERLIGSVLRHITPIRDMAGASVLWVPPPSRGLLLDVGCGNGEFLMQMRRFGWRVQGVEPDPVAAEHARCSGLDVMPGVLEAAGLPAQSCDVITMNHVIEHLADPLRALEECRRLLTANGWLVLVTPNVASLGHQWFRRAWRGLEPPRHLFLFSLATLRSSVERAGLTVLSLRTSSKGASFIWEVSRSLMKRRGETTRRGVDTNPLVKLQGQAFWIAESVWLTASQVGEEIVLVATAGKAP